MPVFFGVASAGVGVSVGATGSTVGVGVAFVIFGVSVGAVSTVVGVNTVGVGVVGFNTTC